MNQEVRGSSADYAVYRQVISQVIHNEEQLPSLPSITLQLRQVLHDEDSTQDRLLKLIIQDPSLAALILKQANSVLYARPTQARTLADAVSMLGRENLYSLVMVHSVKSLFVMKSPALKKLFVQGWQRQAQKTAVCILLVHLTTFKPALLPITGCFLSELGSLAVLSAFKDCVNLPDKSTYINLCREFAKPLGLVLISKWKLDPVYSDITRHAGNWLRQGPANLDACDLVQLALYHSLRVFNGVSNLPLLDGMPCYQKLPVALQVLDRDGLLNAVTGRRAAIREYLGLLP